MINWAVTLLPSARSSVHSCWTRTCCSASECFQGTSVQRGWPAAFRAKWCRRQRSVGDPPRRCLGSLKARPHGEPAQHGGCWEVHTPEPVPRGAGIRAQIPEQAQVCRFPNCPAAGKANICRVFAREEAARPTRRGNNSGWSDGSDAGPPCTRAGVRSRLCPHTQTELCLS